LKETNKIIELIVTLKASMISGKYNEAKNLATIATNFIEDKFGSKDLRIAFFATYYGDACFALGEYKSASLSYDVAYKLHNNANGQYDLETLKSRIKKTRLEIAQGKTKNVEKELLSITTLLNKIAHGKEYILNTDILYASLYINMKQYKNAEDKLASALKISENMLAQREVKEKYQIIDTMCGIHIKKAILFSLQDREYEMVQSSKLAISVSVELFFSLAIVLPAISILAEYAKAKYKLKTKKELEKHLTNQYNVYLDNNMRIAFDKIACKLFN